MVPHTCLWTKLDPRHFCNGCRRTRKCNNDQNLQWNVTPNFYPRKKPSYCKKYRNYFDRVKLIDNPHLDWKFRIVLIWFSLGMTVFTEMTKPPNPTNPWILWDTHTHHTNTYPPFHRGSAWDGYWYTHIDTYTQTHTHTRTRTYIRHCQIKKSMWQLCLDF